MSDSSSKSSSSSSMDTSVLGEVMDIKDIPVTEADLPVEFKELWGSLYFSKDGLISLCSKFFIQDGETKETNKSRRSCYVTLWKFKCLPSQAAVEWGLKNGKKKEIAFTLDSLKLAGLLKPYLFTIPHRFLGGKWKGAGLPSPSTLNEANGGSPA